MRVLNNAFFVIFCLSLALVSSLTVASITADNSTNTNESDNNTSISSAHSYSGETHQNLFNGEGTLATDEFIFNGTFAYGKPIKGRFLFFDESVLLADQITADHQKLTIEGQYQNPQFSYINTGKFALPFSRHEMGLVPNGTPKALGQQTRVYKDGSIYVGHFSGDTPTGKGTRTDANGFDTFEDWYNGKLLSESPGPVTISRRVENQECQFKPPYSDWAWYGFQCQENILTGEGVAYSPDGLSLYTGSVKANAWATGSLEQDNGTILEGDWKNFKLSGDGSEFLNAQLVYSGPFQRGKRHGEGVCLINGRSQGCKYFRGKKLKTQQTLVSDQTRLTSKLQGQRQRIESEQLANLSRQKRTRNQLWRDRGARLEEKENARQREVAQNIQLYQYAYQRMDQTLQEMQVVNDQTTALIQRAQAEQNAKNERKRKEYERKKAEYQAQLKALEEQRKLDEQKRLEARKARLAQQKADMEKELEERKKQCIENGHEWDNSSQYCKVTTEIFIGVTCFDSEGKPRGCTKEEAYAKYAEQNALMQDGRLDATINGVKIAQAPVDIPQEYTDKYNESVQQEKEQKQAEQEEQPLRKKRIKNDIVRVEAIAYCDSDKKQRWWCHGPIQKLILWQDSKEEALSAVGCQRTDEARRVPFQWPKRSNPGWIYFCEYGINSYDGDIAKQYDVPGAILQRRNSYRCKEFSVATCDKLYKRQDGSRPNEEIIPRDTP